MASSLTLGMAAIIWIFVGYWVYLTGVVGRTANYLWKGITTSRAVTVGGFIGGLMIGDALLKIAFGVVAGLGVLGLGDVISLPAEWFAGIVLLIILFFVVTGGSDD